MLDFAEAGHWKRALILLLSCARLVRVQNLVLGTAALRSSDIPPKGGPGARGLRPLGENGCFWTTFLGSDPSKPGIPHRKKKPPETTGRSFQRAIVRWTSPVSVWGTFSILGGKGAKRARKQGTKQQATTITTSIMKPHRVGHSRWWGFRWVKLKKCENK